ncbi:MAG: hypothetical protein BIFFINMI_03708 [Phycisphaerae bacterium]|nr:hypothetical protein [Phycisphaerae bacterium]
MATTFAGWAETEITPPLGLPLGGRGPRATVATRVLDPLSAQAFALQDAAGTRLLWVSLDLIGMGHALAEAIHHDLAAVAGVPAHHVLLNFAHTHSGPIVNYDRYIPIVPRPAGLDDYIEQLRLRLVRLADAAVADLAPAQIAWRQGRSDIAINRRLRMPDGRVQLRPNPAGRRHADLWVLDVRRSGGRAVLFSHACHPVIVYKYLYEAISADFPGRARAALRARLGERTHCQFFQSFAGNVRPRALADLSAGVFRDATAADLAGVGDELAADVLAALDSPGDELAPRLAASETWFAAPLVSPPPGPERWGRLLDPADSMTQGLVDYWRGRLDGGEPTARTFPWPIGLIRLDATHRIVWMGGEVLNEWLDLLRGWLGGGKLMAWGYSHEVAAYLPTEAVLAEGGYEIEVAPLFGRQGPGGFAPGVETAARAAVAELAAVTAP